MYIICTSAACTASLCRTIFVFNRFRCTVFPQVAAAVGSAETRFFTKKWFTPPWNRHRCSASTTCLWYIEVQSRARRLYIHTRCHCYCNIRPTIMLLLVPTITICVVVIVVVAMRRFFSHQAPLHDRENTTITLIRWRSLKGFNEYNIKAHHDTSII